MAARKSTLHDGRGAGGSPWSFGMRVKMMLWEVCWKSFCAWTPKPLNGWRLAWLRLFGARLEGVPFVHPRARIQIPWKLSMGHRACLGDRANAYSLDEISIEAGATVAQEAYLCTGSHVLSDPALPLLTAPIVIGAGAFIGARAFILQGICVGENAVVGACSVVTRDVDAFSVVAGNPARPLKKRVGGSGG